MSRTGALLVGGVVVGLDLLDGYRRHWWYDNLAHFLGGVSVGLELSRFSDDEHTVLRQFLALAFLWECFEYSIRQDPWDGTAVWDHACEDTVLDTVMGLAGTYAALRLAEVR